MEKEFCGVRKDKIYSANPKFNGNLNVMKYWIEERTSILHKKEQGLPYPWTEDPILQKVRFCNVNRQHDKETKYLKEKVCLNENLSLKNKIMNIVLFRMINKSETFEKLGHFPFDFATFDPDVLLPKIKELTEANYTFYSNAFITSGSKIGVKKKFNTEYTILGTIKNIFSQKHRMKTFTTEDQEALMKWLMGFERVGEFLAYQMFVDITYIPKCPLGRNHYTVAVLGAAKGLDLIVDDYDGLTKTEIVFYLKYRDPYFKGIDLSDIENCLCETSKYIRIKESGNYRVARNLYSVGN